MAKKILVVDDEPEVVKILQITLEHAGYQVTTAKNGTQALECVAADKPDLILLDQMMPEMDGLEVTRRLKSDDATDKIPIVILTAKGTESDLAEGWDSGTDLYLLKPVMMSDLVSFVNVILA